MAADDSPAEDRPAAIAAGVRRLALDAHTVLSRATTGEFDDDRAAVAELLHRIDGLRHLLGEGHFSSLRLWLDNLQRQALFVRALTEFRVRVLQELADLRGRVERLEGRQDDTPRA
jgi:hypothetical protein